MKHTHHRGGVRHITNQHRRSGGRVVYLEDAGPDCTYDSVNERWICPDLDVGALPSSNMAPVFKGWNVWNVYQVNDLDFSIMMIGVSRDRQLQIFVEDAVRLNAPGVVVADPADLKGSQVQILNGPPVGLTSVARKEGLPLSVPVVNGPAQLRTVRFFNRGEASSLPWPHDDNYLLDEVFQPTATNPVTAGPAPTTIGATVTGGVLSPIEDAAKRALASPVIWITGGALALYLLTKNKVRKRARV